MRVDSSPMQRPKLWLNGRLANRSEHYSVRYLHSQDMAVTIIISTYQDMPVYSAALHK